MNNSGRSAAASPPNRRGQEAGGRRRRAQDLLRGHAGGPPLRIPVVAVGLAELGARGTVDQGMVEVADRRGAAEDVGQPQLRAPGGFEQVVPRHDQVHLLGAESSTVTAN